MTDARLGVFICDCGGQIGSVLDMEMLERQVRDLPGVAAVHRLCYSCSPDGLGVIQSAVTREGLGRLVVAGCTPRTLGFRFRDACVKAGLAGDLSELVDIREGCAWVHQDDPEAATAKAVDLIQMGIARVARRQARQPVSAEVVPAALVIGGGLAGMTCALTMANSGLPVTLVEREAVLGGMLRKADNLLPDGRSTAGLVAATVEAVVHHPRIQVLTDSLVTAISGTVGRYIVNVDGGTGPAEELPPFEVGAIVVATGARSLQPRGLFRYDGRRVVTQLEFERELRDRDGSPESTSFPSDVVMVLCAGGRNDTVPYCSSVCCVGALKQALEIKSARPEANVTVLFRDLYLLGENAYESKLLEAKRAGVQFIRYAPSSPPRVTDDMIEVRDELASSVSRVPYDRIVLATPLVPQSDASVVARMLKLVQDEHGFFPEIGYRLRPGDHVGRGIYVCGAAHQPCDWIEAEFQAASAAFRALRHLRAGEVASYAPVAVVDETLCTGCGSCVEACSFGAISMRRRDGVLDLSQIDPLLCKGCGNCVVACPVKAISQPVDADAHVLAQIEALAGARDGRPRILAIGCEWSSHAAAELAGVNRLSYPAEVRLMRVRCSARFDPNHILWAFLCGVDGVFLGACRPGDCHYIDGNRHAQGRINQLRSLLSGNGFDPRRLRLEWITADDPHDFVDKITSFTDLVRALGRSPAGMMSDPRNV